MKPCRKCFATWRDSGFGIWPRNDPEYMRRWRIVNRVHLLCTGVGGIVLSICLLAFPDATGRVSPVVAYGFGAFGVVVLCAGLWSIRQNNWRIREPPLDNRPLAGGVLPPRTKIR